MAHELLNPTDNSQVNITSSRPSRTTRALVVDDSPTNRLMICAHLKGEHFETEEAENGAIAVHKAESSHFDLIVMDMQMPMMDGYEATRAIRRSEKARGIKHVPIVAFTVASFEEDVHKALESGADVHIGKPVRKEELLKAIDRLTGSGASSRSARAKDGA